MEPRIYHGLVVKGWHFLKPYSMAILTLASSWALGSAKICAADQHTSSIVFRFRPAEVNGHSALHVNESFTIQKPETEIIVPTHWGEAAHLENQTQNLKVDSAGTLLTEDPTIHGAKLLHAHVGKRVDLSYDIVSQQTEWFRHPQEHMAVINADYFLFNPQNALVYPEMSPTGVVKATFDWRALPRNIPIVTSFGIDQGGDKNRVIRIRAPWFRISHALLAGGNFRIAESRTNGTTVVLAIRGRWKFSDEVVLEDLRRIVDEENRFWHVAPMSYFLVTLAPFDGRSGDNNGGGFTNAFMLFLSHEDTMDSERLQLMAHEMFHHWDPISMGWRSADDVAQWFTEGFTVYYAGVILLRSGLVSYPKYLDYLNLWLRRYELSPLRNINTGDWKSNPASTGDRAVLSYERGAAIALWADATIRARSHGKKSLDDVMFELVHRSQTEDPAPELTEERVLAAFSPYLSDAEMQELHSMAVDGANVPLPETLGCLRRSTERGSGCSRSGIRPKCQPSFQTRDGSHTGWFGLSRRNSKWPRVVSVIDLQQRSLKERSVRCHHRWPEKDDYLFTREAIDDRRISPHCPRGFQILLAVLMHSCPYVNSAIWT